MAVNKPHITEPGCWFITFTNYRWLPLFQITDSYDLVYRWFRVMNEKGHEIIGFVIMPNHLHVLVGFRKTDESLNQLVSNGKRFMAYEIIKRLRRMANQSILDTLAAEITSSDRKKGQLHNVFQPSFDAKLCIGPRFIAQKLKYMHSNPIAGKWRLANDLKDYVHSSYWFYETGEEGVFPVLHYQEFG